MTTYAVAYGTAFDGINLVGPFPDPDSALAYAEGEGDWAIVALEPAPEEFVPPIQFIEN